MSLSLSFLGTFRATLNGQPLTEFYSNKVRALLVYLAVEAEQEHPRPVLAALLWPDWDDRAALGNLRFSLSKLRQVIHDQDARPPFLLINRDTIQFNPTADVSVDVHHFQREVGAGRWESADVDGQPESVLLSALEPLRTAMDLVRGGFLEGFSVGDSVAFEEWALIQRQHLEREVRWCLHGLAALYARLGDYATAELHLRRLLTMDPWDELANRRLMLVLVEEGQRTFALRHYAALQEELARELGCEPEEETQALYAHIRDGTLPAGRFGDTETRRRGEIESPPLRVSVSPAERRVPVAASQFVAREWELARLGSLLEAAVTGRGGVALVAGDAGAGKTALLDEFARRAGLSHLELIALRGSCNAHSGAGDPYLPFREILQTLAGDVEGKRAGGTLSSEQARRAWEALPAVGAALVEHGPDLVDTFIPGEALLRRVEGYPVLSPAAVGRPLGRGLSPRTLSSPADPVLSRGPCPAGQGRDEDRGGTRAGQAWLPRLREIVLGGRAAQAAAPGTTMDAAASRPEFFAQVTQVLHAVSLDKPLLLALDDLQWADGGTAALLFHLGRRLAGSRILLVCAYRPGAMLDSPDPKGLERPLGSVLQELIREWGDVLVDLDRADGRGFVEAYVDSEPNRLGVGFRQALYAHTGGNPLFTVELLRSFERQGALVRDAAGRWIEAHDLDWDQPPARVEAIIAGLLADLPDEDRALLGAAAVQGEQFVAEAVARVLGRDEAAVLRRLSGPLRTRHRLIEALSLERLASSGQRLSRYRFRHSLLQRGAYGSLDPVERGRLHEATASVLEGLYAAEGTKPPALAPELARHREAAGMPLQAARALHDAGRQAMRVAAFREALDQFEHGLALLASVPPSPECAEIARLLNVAKLGPQRNLEGLLSARLVGALAQASQAWAGRPEVRPALTILWGQAERLFATAQYRQGLEAAERLREQAMQWGEETFVALAHWRYGTLYHSLGELEQAESHLAWMLDWLTPEGAADARAAVGLDLEASALAFSALDQWFLGYPETALTRSRRGIAGATQRGDAYGQAFSSAMGCTLLFLLRDAAALADRVEQCSSLCRQHGFRLWQAYADVFLGRLAAARGEATAGVEQIKSTLAAWQKAGPPLGTDSLILVLADTCLQLAGPRPPAGDSAAGAGRAALLATGLEAVESRIGPGTVQVGYGYPAELYRLRGELLLAQDGPGAAAEALECFQTALRLAGEHGLRCPELRAAMSLVRLRDSLRSQGAAFAAELAEARQCLREVYGRFTEGFAFPDLQDAAALIENEPRRGIGETR